MKLVPKDTRLDPPNICFICESTPLREVGQQVVDTEHIHTPSGPTNLRGRKYVCEGCIRGMVKVLEPTHVQK